MHSRGFGLDFALGHGAFVEVVKHRTKGLASYNTLFSWRTGLSSKIVEPSVVWRWTDDLRAALLFHAAGMHILTDWTPNEIFWKGSHSAAITKAYALGFITGALEATGFTFIDPYTPARVRAFFSLRPNAKKEDVHARFLAAHVQSTLLRQRIEKNLLGRKTGEDILDAIILAYIGASLHPTEM